MRTYYLIPAADKYMNYFAYRKSFPFDKQIVYEFKHCGDSKDDLISLIKHLEQGATFRLEIRNAANEVITAEIMK